MKTFQLYTDGSCLGNPGPGGWAAIIRDGKKEKILVGHESLTTNNRMEMLAVIEGLKWIRAQKNKSAPRVEIFSDSRLLIHSIQQGWKRKSNVDLWQELDTVREGLECHWNWVKGHAGHEFNERCDRLAVAEAEKLKAQLKSKKKRHESGGSIAKKSESAPQSEKFDCNSCGKTSEGLLGYLKESKLIRVDCVHCGEYIKFASPTPTILERAKRRPLMTSQQIAAFVQKCTQQGQPLSEKQQKKFKAMTVKEAQDFLEKQKGLF